MVVAILLTLILITEVQKQWVADKILLKLREN